MFVANRDQKVSQNFVEEVKKWRNNEVYIAVMCVETLFSSYMQGRVGLCVATSLWNS